MWYKRTDTKRMYKMSKISSFGPIKSSISYFSIRSIAIDLINTLCSEKKLVKCWNSVPNNRTFIKLKIVHLLLRMSTFLVNLSSIWGTSKLSSIVHHNDCVHIFGIIMSISGNHRMFQRFAECCILRRNLEDPVYILQQIYQNISFQFNNNLIVLILPPDTYDVDRIVSIATNDPSHICIIYDGTYCIMINIFMIGF